MKAKLLRSRQDPAQKFFIVSFRNHGNLLIVVPEVTVFANTLSDQHIAPYVTKVAAVHLAIKKFIDAGTGVSANILWLLYLGTSQGNDAGCIVLALQKEFPYLR